MVRWQGVCTATNVITDSHSYWNVLQSLLFHVQSHIVSVSWNVTHKLNKEKEKTAGGMMQLYRTEDKHGMPLELQLFVITAKHTHYVTLQLRLATFMAIWWRTSPGAFGCTESQSECFLPFFHLQPEILSGLYNHLSFFSLSFFFLLLWLLLREI